MSAVFVVGGAGYIGSHVCKRLFKEGLSPVVIDNFSTGHKTFVKWGPLVECSLSDKDTLNQAFARYKPIAVLHFAASALIPESMVNPGKYYENNVGGTISLLNAMVRHHVPSLIFSSTCATYGNPLSTPISEEHSQKPINPYGKSKLMVEEILKDFQMVHGLSSVALRYFNAAGADFDREVGENHSPETHLIPSIMEAALGKREACVLYGQDFPTPDGSAIRDYIHVMDLAEAHLKALLWVMKHGTSLQLNLGTGQGTSVLEIFQAIQKLVSKPIPHHTASRRHGDPSHLVADATKAQEIFQWTPRHSSLSDILESAWEWHR